MSKPRIVIPFSVQFTTRYVVQTGLLERIAEYAQPVVLCRWDDTTLKQEVEAAGGEYHQLPRVELQTGYTRVKRQLDMWHLQRLQSPTTAIDARRNALIQGRNARQRFRDAFYRLNLALPGKPARLRERMQVAIRKYTNIEVFDTLLTTLNTDVVFSLTPYFHHEQLLLYAASQRELPLYTSIISFDNLTTRGLIPVIFDAYLVWNSYNEAELRRIYPEAHDRPVKVVGAPQFDFYWDSSYVWDEVQWRKLLKLPPDRPVILFGAGHFSIVPNEPDWLEQIDDAIEAKRIPGNPIILFRRHPNDPLDRWRSVLGRARHVVYDEPWLMGDRDQALTSIRRQDIEKLTSTLAHSVVHINASSTMTVDGAILDRPQIGPAYDDRPGGRYDRVVKELYLREHYLPITKSGGLAIVNSREEMLEAIRVAFDDPIGDTAGRKRMVREICTFDDGKCTERVSEALRAFLIGKT
jgi:hypothetical protein